MKQKTRARAQRAAAKPSPTTALVRLSRDAQRVMRAVEHKLEILAPAAAKDDTALTLGDEATIGSLGLVEIRLNEREEQILSEKVRVEDVLIKPTGQPYLSHPNYTRWFNRAFGRFGWAIVPCSKPQRSGNSVVCPYLLYIHQQPAAFAMGEQEYFENNREQTFGDALEATVASALRRCAKRLGVGLELWDKRFLNAFIAEYCEKVWVEGDSKPKWRRKDEPPFWNERGAGVGDEHHTRQESRDVQSQPRTPPRAGQDRGGDIAISDAQRKRLWVIMTKSGRNEDDVRGWLSERYGITSTKAIPRRLYEAICTAVEARGPLPAREPGED